MSLIVEEIPNADERVPLEKPLVVVSMAVLAA
jgi:hypothetical protein